MKLHGSRRMAILLLAAVVASWWPTCACAAERQVAACAREALHAEPAQPAGCCGPQRSEAPSREHGPRSCACHPVELFRAGGSLAAPSLPLAAASAIAPAPRLALPCAERSFAPERREVADRPPPTPVERHTLLLL